MGFKDYMDWNHVDDKGTKRQGMSEEQRDMVSHLPEEVLVHILSFLPIRDAVRTSLIRCFGTLWRCVPVIDFDQCLYHDCYNGPYYTERFINSIHQVMRFNDSRTLDKLRLRFSFHKDYWLEEKTSDGCSNEEAYLSQLQRRSSEISSLVQYAVYKRVKILDLDLLGCGYYELLEDYTLPEIVLRNDCLIDLRLAFCSIDPRGEINLESLRVLSLTLIELSDKMMEKFLQGCPFLEDLSLVGCYGLTKLYLVNSKLRKLALDLHLGERIVISSPSVKTMEIAGCVERAMIIEAGLFSSASLSLSSRSFRYGPNQYNGIKRLLQDFSHCHTFKPCSICILVLSMWELSNLPCPYNNWKKLILSLDITKWHHPGISLLLRRSPYLEILEIKIYKGSDSIAKFETKLIEVDDFDAERFWKYEVTFCHLKKVSIHGNILEPAMLEFVKFLLRSATVLEKMEITFKKTSVAAQHDQIPKNDKPTSEELLQLSEILAVFYRASSTAEILLC